MTLIDIMNDYLSKAPNSDNQVKIEKTTKSKKSLIDWIDIDFRVFQAILKFRFDGCSFTKLVDTCPTFIRRNNLKNRQLIKESLESLKDRGFVSITGHGRDTWVQGVNGVSTASYFPRNTRAPIAVVYRRTTSK